MVFHVTINNQRLQLALNLHHKFDPFYIDHAVVKNRELCCFATNDEKWFGEFQKNWGDDPVVSTTPPIQSKLSLVEWSFFLLKPEHKSFCDHRYTVTGAELGFIAFRSILENAQIVSEFYAIGSKEDSSYSQSMILDPIFVKQAFRTIIPQFKTKIDKNKREKPAAG